jgi:hypothetical protein
MYEGEKYQNDTERQRDGRLKAEEQLSIISAAIYPQPSGLSQTEMATG